MPEAIVDRPLAMRIRNGVFASLAAALPLAAVLLITAGLTPGGTWIWPSGLWFVGIYGAISLTANLALAVFRPANFKTRQQAVVATRERRQPLIDAVGTGFLIVYWLAWLAFIPIDVFHLHLAPRPSAAISAVGGACALLGLVVGQLAVWENAFATPNVQDQSDRGQTVIDSGVYGLIRHPIYAGNLLLFGGMALWLGSTAAFIGVGVILAGTIARIAIEEGQLRASLPGYADYARRVRGRLIPFVL